MHAHEERLSVPLYVIVDMQPRWASAHAIVGAVEGILEEAARTNSKIIVLEMKSEPGSPHSRTFKRILDRMAALGITFIVMRKTTPSGHREIQQALKQTGWKADIIRYVGVKTSQCVSHTVGRMSEIFTGSLHQVLAWACNDTGGNDWNRFARGTNIEIVHRQRKSAA